MLISLEVGLVSESISSNLAYEANHVIGDRYRLIARLGAGGMGEVWRAEHVTLKSPVALKFINPGLTASATALQRFMREAQSSAALRSTHIVQVFDFGVDDGVPYIAMELLNGESLGERLEREGALTPATTAIILSHVARAMTHAHQAGIVHRDLKPDNIFIVHEHDTLIAKVLDFGVAKVTAGRFETTTGGGTKTGSILGTPFYVSPEQARGNKEVDHRSDLWALGVIAYQCLTNTLPFQSDGLGDLLMQICGDPQPAPSKYAKVPMGFDAWMDKALQKSPDQRFQSASEMVDAFVALLSQPSAAVDLESQPGIPSQTVAPGLAVTAVPQSTRRARKAPWLWAAAGCLGASLAAAGWWHYRTSPDQQASGDAEATQDLSKAEASAAAAPPAAAHGKSIDSVDAPAPTKPPPATTPSTTIEPPRTPTPPPKRAARKPSAAAVKASQKRARPAPLATQPAAKTASPSTPAATSTTTATNVAPKPKPQTPSSQPDSPFEYRR